MSTALDAAQTVFYALGSIALLLGGVLGVRRFGFEAPHKPSWKVTVSAGHLRVAHRPAPEYLHGVDIRLSNESRALQSIEGTWLQIFAPTHPDFDPARFHQTPSTSDGMRLFFERAMSGPTSLVPPGNEVMLGQTMGDSIAHDVFRVNYAVLGRRPRLLRPGFHADTSIVASGSTFVFVDLEDLKHYSVS